MRKIKRLLIANRGEIACRIVATCRAMEIETVTIFAGDDRDLPHARAGDTAVMLAGKNLADTYLNIDQIIAVAQSAGADAIHPGYGFLSENARFAEAVTKAGLIFVGPPAEAVARMGDKAESRELCQQIGVPVVPGYNPSLYDSVSAADFVTAADTIGYPVLVKAAAGGGGKGMRIVENVKDLKAALESARSEAKNAFGDDRLLLEKYLTQPRHIEVQIFSDTHGNHLHLFERECSIQRRHQKIIEESPACHLNDATRKRMFEAATMIASHIGYVGAGTVEFIVDSNGEFYFLEMNTRLQVEHPVTEMITGLDLVQLQLEIAQGEQLKFKQEEISQNGHAIEVRLYAEDSDREFLPSPGTLTRFISPHLPYVRCENGYMSGNTVSGSYDPMIAKLAVWGVTREEAIARLLNALGQTQISGVINNRAFLMRVLNHRAFREGQTTTDFIAQHKNTLTSRYSGEEIASLAAAYLLSTATIGKTASASGTEYSAWNNPRLAGMR